jgi:hypothetical protein
MSPFQNEESSTNEIPDPAKADPKTDYEPPDNENQSGPGGDPNTGG